MELASYRRCIGQQLEELELLSSIYCGAGELQLLDAGVVADFNEFMASDAVVLRSHLEYIIKLSISGRVCVDVRIELPHLYPQLELARITVHTTLLGKLKEQRLKADIDAHLAEQRDAEEAYIFQLLTWLQEHIETLMLRPESELENQQLEEEQPKAGNLERLWIYSHHIKSSAKRQEIVRQARQLDLSGFSRPGKPGIICVEGQPEQVQQYWRDIKSLRWQKITLVKTEQHQRKRFFDKFSEQLFNASDDGNDEGVMNMGQFIKFLEAHGTGYMKSELFGLV
ncbi:RWD domain-containing protein 2A [Drosophila albomicans]|uniref:RWD domain-containing protein 2A n=1 Tax=Drosophila albomicans TaxID=7291 RepID=A0A6P8WUY7_DROAB|nr:RWD domain-containing protein 2A [Drosophila albomicans]